LQVLPRIVGIHLRVRMAQFFSTEREAKDAWTFSGFDGGNVRRHAPWGDVRTDRGFHGRPNRPDYDPDCQEREDGRNHADGRRDCRCEGEGHGLGERKYTVYHKDDAQYGKTKHGKFMTEADAQAAGYRMAKASPSDKKVAAPTAASPQ
jgi:hypothetical protein